MGENPLDSAIRIVPCHLAKEQGAEPGPAVKGAHTLVAIVPGNELLELGTRNELDELGKTVDCAMAWILLGRKVGVSNPFLP